MEKLVFFRIGWMDRYQGLDGDEIVGGGSFVEKEHYGHEIFNFKPHNGKMYGYVKPRGESINISRIANAPVNDDFIDGVTVVWVAKNRSGGVFIVGWYKNAKVYNHYKKRPLESYSFDKEEFLYITEANSKNYILLPWDERVFEIPTRDKGMGQSNVWYAGEEENKNFRKLVLDYINHRIIPKNYIKKMSNARQKGKPLQLDPLKRKDVERNAINEVINFYENFGYLLSDKQGDNVGWDLEASLGNQHFKIEVKGLSGSEIFFELTPNEYKKMKEFKEEYIICVVTNALDSKIKLHRFLFSSNNNRWEDENGNILNFQDIVAARCSV